MPASVVTFHYTLRDTRGRLLDTSQGGQPISYLEGTGQIIDGLEADLLTAVAGEKRTVTVAAAKAYGEHDARLVQKISRQVIPAEEIKVGDTFQTGPDRHDPIVTIMAIEGDEVTLDANHPLAGEDLVFDVEVVAKRTATPEELAHGHAHGADGAAGH